MSITKETIKEVTLRFAGRKGDTGSPELQIALFTHHIKSLTGHMKTNHKDYQARKGLLSFVVKRKRLLIYLKNKKRERYESLIKELKLKKI